MILLRHSGGSWLRPGPVQNQILDALSRRRGGIAYQDDKQGNQQIGLLVNTVIFILTGAF